MALPAGVPALERVFGDLPGVPFKGQAWPGFRHENARRVLRLDTP